MKKTIRIIALAMVALTLMLTLASCGAKPNSDPDAAEKALEEAGYEVVSIPALGVNGLDKNISATKIDGDKVDAVTIFYFKDSDSAESAYELIEKQANEAKEEMEDVAIGKSGKMIWFGTKDAVKAAN